MLTTRSTFELAQRHGVDMPITASVYRVLYEKKDLGEAVRELVTHPLKSEYD